MKFHAFMVDPQLGGMGAESWLAWQAVARILDGDAALLTPAELDLARQITQRDRFPDQPVSEFYAGPSRRSGKTRFGQCRAVWRLSQDYRPRLAPGEYAVVACVAPTTEQASILFNYARATVLESPLLAGQVVRESATEIEFAHRAVLRVYAGSFRSTRGMSFAAVFVDEASFLRSDDSALPDVELIRAVQPGLMTLRGDLIVMSSPYMKRGAMFAAYRKHFGNNDSPALYVGGESILFNPTLDRAGIAKAYDDDPESAAAEWGGLHRAELSAALDPEWIDRAIDTGVPERPRSSMLPEGRAPHYVAFTDPAGGAGRDSWATRVVHAEGDDVIDDGALEIRPPFNTGEAAGRVAQFLKSYGISGVTGDRYAGAWPRDALAEHGVGYMESERTKSEIYLECVALFSAGRVRLLDHARTITQLRQLERRTRSGGRDSVDHPPGGSDDCSNALCGALLRAARNTKAAALRKVFVVPTQLAAPDSNMPGVPTGPPGIPLRSDPWIRDCAAYNESRPVILRADVRGFSTDGLPSPWDL